MIIHPTALYYIFALYCYLTTYFLPSMIYMPRCGLPLSRRPLRSYIMPLTFAFEVEISLMPVMWVIYSRPLAALILPYPQRIGSSAVKESLTLVSRITSLISLSVRSGFACSHRATIPLTTGHDIDVPLSAP